MTQSNGRRQLLDAALETFRQVGYAAASLAEISDRATELIPSSRVPFDSKEQLLTELVEPFLDDLESTLDRFPRHPSWPDQGRGLLVAYLGVLIKHHVVAAWIDTDQAVLEHPRLGTRLGAINRRMREAIRGDNRSTAARLGAAAVIGTLWRPLRNEADIAAGSESDAIIAVAMAAVATVRMP